MSDAKNGAGGDDQFLAELEAGVRHILKNRKSTKSDKLAAINAGVRLAAIKHRIANGTDQDEGFFGK